VVFVGYIEKHSTILSNIYAHNSSYLPYGHGKRKSQTMIVSLKKTSLSVENINK
jgi:hypothetical protein